VMICHAKSPSGSHKAAAGRAVGESRFDRVLGAIARASKAPNTGQLLEATLPVEVVAGRGDHE
jgi:hypothetical protein